MANLNQLANKKLANGLTWFQCKGVMEIIGEKKIDEWFTIRQFFPPPIFSHARYSTDRSTAHPWLWPTKPWRRIHIDFAGPFLKRMFLLVTDAHSKWPEIIEMASTTSTRTIEELRRLFAAYGLPKQVVTDSGPQFVSQEFANFMKLNGIKRIKTVPYHPASNGAIERLVQMFKKSMMCKLQKGVTISQLLSSFLLSYRTTPHSTTNVAPAELFMNQNIRTRLDLIHPNIESTASKAQGMQ